MKNESMTIGPRIKQNLLTVNKITEPPLLPIIHDYDKAPERQTDTSTEEPPLHTMEQLKAEKDRQLEELALEKQQVEEEEKAMFEQWYNPTKNR